MRAIFRYLLPHTLEQFEAWALGEQITTAKRYMARWNTLHAELFVLDGYGDICEDAVRMVELWERTTHV